MLNSWCRPRSVWQFVPALLFVTITAGQSPLASSAATAYGLQFVRLGKQWPDGGPAADLSGGAVDASQQLEFQRQVAERELASGPYTDALAEPLAALALQYRSSGNLEQAERFYRRALHVVRVNDGLYSERQIPILRELLNTYRVAGDMETLDERYEYFFRLYGRGQPPYTDIRLRAALEYLRWQREALRLELRGEEKRRLLALYEMNEELLQAVATEPSVDPVLYRNLGLSQLRNLYLIQNRIKPTVERVGAVPTTPLIASDWNEQDFSVHKLETYQRGAVSRGVQLLESLLARESGGAVDGRALLQLELADWYQWNGNDRRAAEHYAEVERLLSASGKDRTLREWLGQPVELPDNGAFWQPLLLRDEQRRVVVEASYDVSARGRVSNIETRAAQEEDEGVATRLRRKLARTRFRPRYTGGQPEAVAGIRRKYELVD